MEDIVTAKQLHDAVPKWLIGFVGSLMAVSLFINSIGFNLMSVNGALTEYAVNSIAAREGGKATPKLVARIEKLEHEIKELKLLAHKSSKAH